MSVERGFFDRNGNFVPEKSLLGQFLSQETGQAPQVVFRSNFTPDLTVSLSPGASKQSSETGPGFGMLLEFIQPEFEIEILGQKHSVAPYGRPDRKFLGPVITALAVVGAGYGAYKAYKYWKKKS